MQTNGEKTTVLVFQELDCLRSYKRFDKYVCKYSTKGEGKYTCIKCNRSWSSVKCLGEFKYHMSVQKSARLPKPKIRLFGQRCRKCKGAYMIPGVDDDQIYYMLEKFVYFLIRRFYVHNGEKVKEEIAELKRNYQRTGQGRHMSELCEGCRNGKLSIRRLSW